MADGDKLVVIRDPGDLVEADDLSEMLKNFYNGSFLEKTATVVDSDGVTVTLTLERDGGGDLTMRFSDGFASLDCTPACSVTLTAGSLASPTENFVHIPISTKVLTVSTSDWPTGEHIKVAYCFVESPTEVQTDSGSFVHQPWNDGSADSGENGHMLDIAERTRLGSGANWYSGVAGAGATGYLTITPGSPDSAVFQSAAGIVYQLHRHAFASLDTGSGDDLNLVNHSTTPNARITDLWDIDEDSTGATLDNKYFNVVFFGVANRTGRYSPVMALLPTGSYNTQAGAEVDADRHTVVNIPSPYFIKSSTGFLICRMLLRRQSAGGGTLSLIETEDLRGIKPSTTGGAGAGGSQVEFSDNVFKLFDETTADELAWQLSGLTANRTITALDADGTDALSDAVLTPESIPFVDASGRLDEDTTFVRDSATGNVGINQSNPGAKLEVGGQIKVTGGSPGAGKVLTDVGGTGLATWEAPSGGGGGGGWVDDGTVVRLETATDQVAVGTASPSAGVLLTAHNDINGVAPVYVQNPNAGTGALAEYRVVSSTATTLLRSFGGGYNLAARFGQTLAGKTELLHTGGTGLLLGTLEADPVVIGTNNSEALTIHGSTGNVGVGPTGATDVELHVRKDQNGTTSSYCENNTAGTAARALQQIVCNATGVFTIANSGSTTGNRFGIAKAGFGEILHTGAAGLMIGTLEADPLHFGTADTLAMTIDSSQNVGIGTSAPAEAFEVVRDDDVSAQVYQATADANSPGFNMAKSRGTMASPADLQAGDVSGNVRYKGWINGGFDVVGSLRTSVGTVGATFLSGEFSLRLNDAAGALTTRMFIDEDGQAGLGTESPVWDLHLHKASSLVSALAFTNNTTGATATDGFAVGIDSAERGFVWNYEATDLYFATSNLERMRILSGGNVGIRTANPLAALDVAAGTGVAGTPGTGADELCLRATAGAGAGMTVMLGSGEAGRLDFAQSGRTDSLYLKGTSHATQSSERFDFFVGGNEVFRMGTGTGALGFIINRTGNDVDSRFSTTGLTFGLHVDSSADAVGAGGAANASYALAVTGSLRVSADIDYVGDLNDISDAALKENVGTLSDHLGSVRDKYMALRPVRFTWKETPFLEVGQRPPGGPADFKYGFISQELATVFPEVTGTTALGNLLDPSDPQPGDEDYQEFGGERTGEQKVYLGLKKLEIVAITTTMVQWLVGHAETTRALLDVAKDRVLTLESQMAQVVARVEALENA